MAVVVVDVLAQVAAALHKADAAALEAFWTPVATQALAAGLRDVRGILHARGLSTQAVEAWSGYESAVLQQSLFWALTAGGGLQGGPDNWVKQLDLRESLKTMSLDELGTTAVGYGKIKVALDETFRDPNRPEDPQRPGQWRPW